MVTNIPFKTKIRRRKVTLFHIAKETVFQRKLLFLLPYRGTGQQKICLTLFLPEIGVLFSLLFSLQVLIICQSFPIPAAAHIKSTQISFLVISALTAEASEHFCSPHFKAGLCGTVDARPLIPCDITSADRKDGLFFLLYPSL